MTIPIERVKELPLILDAFSETCWMFGSDPRLFPEASNNAGLHLSFLWHRTYPTRRRLKRRSLDNYKRNVRRLKNALIFLGSDGKQTRTLDMRYSDCYDKYDQIAFHDDTCMEFRVFDPCFSDPERVLQNFMIMANTLDFFNETCSYSLEWDPVAIQRIVGTYQTSAEIELLESIFDTDAIRNQLKKELAYFCNGLFPLASAEKAIYIIDSWKETGK